MKFFKTSTLLAFALSFANSVISGENVKHSGVIIRYSHSDLNTYIHLETNGNEILNGWYEAKKVLPGCSTGNCMYKIKTDSFSLLFDKDSYYFNAEGQNHGLKGYKDKIKSGCNGDYNTCVLFMGVIDQDIFIGDPDSYPS
ncbi:hypothetical protein BB559_006687 [Furculomyces boomerangus]|uniref:Uncharacterized protein n=1 Tax=Furculomyces boomerangus TaxID=61424 RepID=A0A2T9Y157_9FUNG|nr:hypothetical protein BB559_006687 [Furculomyces boomerangus]